MYVYLIEKIMIERMYGEVEDLDIKIFGPYKNKSKAINKGNKIVENVLKNNKNIETNIEIADRNRAFNLVNYINIYTPSFGRTREWNIGLIKRKIL